MDHVRAVFLASVLSAAPVLPCQCQPVVLPSHGIAAGPTQTSVVAGNALWHVRRWGGDLVVAGGLTSIGGVPANRIARWDGSQWHALQGVGTNGVNGTIRTLGELPDGSLLIGGDFSMAGGQPSANLARFGSSGWGAGYVVQGAVYCHAVLPNGDLVVGGYLSAAGGVSASRIARRSNGAWFPMAAGFDDLVEVLCVRSNGELIAGGQFLNSGGTPIQRLARWDGTSWQPLASSCNGAIRAIHERPDGDLVVSGWFTSIDGVAADRVARLEGNTWHSMSNQSNNVVNRFVELPDGTLGAFGFFSLLNGVPVSGAARWDGTTWSSLGVTFGTGSARDGEVFEGELVLAGSFQTVNGVSSPYLARRTTTCPAAATQLAAGCGGPLLDAGTSFAGGTWSANVTGIAAPAIVALVAGSTPAALPLGNVLPTAAAGCVLHVQPEFVDLAVATGSQHTWTWTLPADPSLAGASWHHQSLVVELPATGGLGTAWATDAFSLTVGVF
jgi:uncharacterized protein YjeT (DUF2065 family)